MTGALTYLAVRSIRNAIVTRLHRLRQPRYMLVALGVLLYFGMMVANRRRTGVFNIPPEYDFTAQVVAAALFFTIMIFGWILPAGSALQFSLADIHFLFPAPVTRPHLLGYKIARIVLGAMGSALFFALFVGPTRLLPALAFWAKTTSIMSVIAVHEAGVSLYRTRAKEAGHLQAKSRWIVYTAGALLAASSAWMLAWFAFASGGEVVVLSLIVLGILLAHAAWILTSDAAFEEEAALLAENVRAAAKGEPSNEPVVVKRPGGFALAPRGPVETAILWKNWIMFRRAGAISLFGVITIASLLVAAFIIGDVMAGDRENPMPIIGFAAAGLVVLMGPIGMRYDLRRDLANLALIKTWPVSGAAIFRGEVLMPWALLTAGATAGLVVGFLFSPASLLGASLVTRLGFTVAGTLAAAVLIAAQLVIQNGIAVVFPAWIRHTPGAGAGVEMMGQMMVVMYGGVFVLLVAALLPAAAAAVIFFTAGGAVLPAVAFALLLGVETWAATEVLGRILDRTDIQDVPTDS